MKYEPKLAKEMMCPIEYGLDLFGGKWKSRILCGRPGAALNLP